MNFIATNSRIAPLSSFVVEGTNVAVVELSDKHVSINVAGAWKYTTPAKYDVLLAKNIRSGRSDYAVIAKVHAAL